MTYRGSLISAVPLLDKFAAYVDGFCIRIGHADAERAIEDGKRYVDEKLERHAQRLADDLWMQDGRNDP